jgi:hypothetical protein
MSQRTIAFLIYSKCQSGIIMRMLARSLEMATNLVTQVPEVETWKWDGTHRPVALLMFQDMSQSRNSVLGVVFQFCGLRT